MTSIYVAVPIPPPDRWVFVHDRNQVPDGYMVAAGLRGRSISRGALTATDRERPTGQLQTFVFWVRDPRTSALMPLACESRGLAEAAAGRVSDIVEVVMQLDTSA